MLPLRARVDLGAMAMKRYSAFPKAPALLEPHHQIVKCHIQDTRWGGHTPLQRSSRCILQPQPTGQISIRIKKSTDFWLRNNHILSIWAFVFRHFLTVLVGYSPVRNIILYPFWTSNQMVVCLFGWFFGLWTLVGLFNTEVSFLTYLNGFSSNKWWLF